MKSPLLIGVSALTLLAVSATLFAQTTTGSSLITEMKAAVRSFTLAADLNPGITGLQSAPVSGKVTGDMLTAGEYNRILELVGQGGGGGVGGKFEITDATIKTSYSIQYTGVQWISNPNIATDCTSSNGPCKQIETAPHDFCMINSVAGSSPHVNLGYAGGKKYIFNNATRESSSISVVCYDNIGSGGGGGGGAGWVDVPTTDTADFDMNCLYRVDATGSVLGGSNIMRYSTAIQPDRAFFGFNLNPGWIGGFVVKSTKGTFGTNSNGTFTVTKLQKLCAGTGGGGSGDSAPSGTLCGLLFTRRYGLNTTTCDSISSIAKCAGQTLSVPASCGTTPCELMTGCPSGYAPIQSSYSWGGGQTMQAPVYAYHQCSCAKQ